MIWKRQIPILIVAFVGSLTLFGWFISEPTIKEFVEDDATQWYNILASFAAILGSLNLIKIQAQKVLHQKPGWGYSMIAVLGFIFAIVAGFFIKGTNVEWGAHVSSDGTLFKWMFDYVFSPMSATMFSSWHFLLPQHHIGPLE